MNRLLIFDLKGNMAHFRKFYTNSSSLSYSFPPRTTITGLIAGMLGRARDSYYEEFDTNNCKVAISIKNPIRKLMQTVNYIWTKDGYATAKGVIKRFIEKQINKKYPTPIELVVPSKFTDEIRYRVYFYHRNTTVMDALYLMLEKEKTIYPMFLGLSEFLAKAEFVADVSLQEIKVYETEKTVDIVSVCNTEYIAELESDTQDTAGAFQYIDERMPLEFAMGREIKRTANFIHEKNQKTIRAKLNIPYTEVIYTDRGSIKKEIIAFME